MVEEIGIPRTARLMVLLRCYKRRRKPTINLRLEQLRLGTSIYDESRKRVWVKVETCRQTDGERHRPKHGITRVASKCNQQRMLSQALPGYYWMRLLIISGRKDWDVSECGHTFNVESLTPGMSCISSGSSA